MKNKKATWLLISAVIAVWGIIFYRIFMVTRGDDAKIDINTFAKIKEEPLDIYQLRDTIALKLDYQDPMLRNLADDYTFDYSDLEEKQYLPVMISNPQSFQQPEPYVEIEYKGYVANGKGKGYAAIISIDGRELMMEEGNSLEGLKLVKSFRDSIRVSYKGKFKVLKLQ